MKILQKLRIQKDQAFTIVETLVAISILMVSITGPLVIISQALKISFFARDQITAIYLAQEAIEYVRNVRDRNSLVESLNTSPNPDNWLLNMTSSPTGSPEVNPLIAGFGATPSAKYNLFKTNSSYDLRRCSTPICPRIKLHLTTGMYGQNTALLTKNSIYRREITFQKAPGDDTARQEVLVQVVVTWTQVGGTYTFKLHEHLTNWKIQNYQES